MEEQQEDLIEQVETGGAPDPGILRATTLSKSGGRGSFSARETAIPQVPLMSTSEMQAPSVDAGLLKSLIENEARYVGQLKV